MKDIQKHNPDIVLIVGDFVDLISKHEKNKVHVMQDDVELEASCFRLWRLKIIAMLQRMTVCMDMKKEEIRILLWLLG